MSSITIATGFRLKSKKIRSDSTPFYYLIYKSGLSKNTKQGSGFTQRQCRVVNQVVPGISPYRGCAAKTDVTSSDIERFFGIGQ